MYEKTPYWLPVSLEIGDRVLIEGTGAYTATYSSVAFNGLPPLRTHVIWRRLAVSVPGAGGGRATRARFGAPFFHEAETVSAGSVAARQSRAPPHP